MNGISPDDLQLLNTGLTPMGIKISLSKDETTLSELKCSFINNPDGTLRWIWPADSRSTAFLKFYHIGNMRARVMAMVLRLCAILGLERMTGGGRCKLYINNRGANVINKLYDWALFTGTVGENRKFVAWYSNVY